MYILWRLARWFLGYAQFEIRGISGERFITLCMKNQVELWEIRRVCPGIIQAKAYLSSLSLLEGFSHKCGVTLENVCPVGFSRFLKRYRLRPGLFFGVGLYVLLLFLLPRFVWSVTVPGADPIRREQIQSVLLEEGFGIGTFVPGVNFKELRYRLMDASPEIAFVSVNMQGSRAVVEVRFAQPAPEITETTPCNLVASRDGQILSVLVRNGIRYVQKGQTVQQGDLLVGGIVDTRLGYYVVHSEAEIFARVTDTDSRTVPLIRTVTERTGKEQIRRVWSFFGKEWDVSPKFSCRFSSYETEVEKKRLSFGEDSAVPIILTEIRYYETVSREEEITPEEAEFYARRALDESDRLRLCGVTVESMKETVTSENGAVTVTRTRSLIMDICEEKEFYFEDEGT